jgi:hypothetical protein
MINYKIDNVISTHSFNSYQVSVVEYLDAGLERKKGIAVTPIPYYLYEEATHTEAIGDFGKPLELTEEEMRKLDSFISGVLAGDLPAKIIVNNIGPKLRIKLNNLDTQWHGGGGYKGRVGFGIFGALSFTNNAVVSKESLTKLQESLKILFESKPEV